jgi:molybdopterin converting factor small subunit
VLFFGRLGEAAGKAETAVDLPSSEMELEAFRDLVTHSNPELAKLILNPSVRTVINQAMVLRDAVVRDGDEVAFLPAVSGG